MKIIIKESQFDNLRLRRNLDKLPNYINSTYKWLNPKAFDNFDEFINRVIFSSTRDYVAEFTDNSETYEQNVESLENVVRDIIMNEYYDVILDYYSLP